MSRQELSRLVEDTISDPAMIQEAMSIKNQAGMEAFITVRGYRLTEMEILEIWDLTSRLLSGRSEPMSAARWRIETIKNETLAAPK